MSNKGLTDLSFRYDWYALEFTDVRRGLLNREVITVNMLTFPFLDSSYPDDISSVELNINDIEKLRDYLNKFIELNNELKTKKL